MNDSPDPDAGQPAWTDIRHEALRDELTELLGVVEPSAVGDILLERAFELNVTDLHLEPTERGVRVRLRVDGLLHDVLLLPFETAQPVISRLKLMGGMDITERRLAQDGHISHAVLKQPRDIRVGSGPTIHGERLVLRLMPDRNRLTGVDDLGLYPEQLETLRRSIAAPYGLILIVGPVGCGKTTTVYSCIRELNDPQKSVVTIEDPVEQRISGLSQIQVDPRIGFHFADALRGMLRQDPDVMMVGEIRDAETAQIACRSALTGVLVLSTLHANNTASTVDVLEGFGIPRMVIADSLRCIVSQRLALRVCPDHHQAYHPDEATCRLLGIPPEESASVSLLKGIAHDDNFHTGYSGRTGVFEVLEIDRDLRRAILDGCSAGELGDRARASGLQSLADSAKRKVLDGVTTTDQMNRTLLSYSED